MQRISVYIPEETKMRIRLTAKAESKAESEVVRAALKEGLKKIHPVSRSANALLELSRLAEQLPSQPGKPKDVSKNHDYYAWGGKKR